MTTHPDHDLRTTLHRIADTTDPLPVADDLWRRGQRARRRGQVLAVAAVLAVLASVSGVVTLVSIDREVRTASTEVVEGGAIPSRIMDPGELTLETDLTVGRASVAFVSAAGQPIVVGASDGEPHALDLTGWDGGLLSLSPDGTHLAWTIESDPDGRPRDGFELMDLSSGDFQLMSSGVSGLITPEGISWAPSSRWLTWYAGDTVTRTGLDVPGVPTVESSALGKQIEWSAIDDDGGVTLYAAGPRRWRDGTVGRMHAAADEAFAAERRGRNDVAVTSPTGDTVTLGTTASAPAADFLVAGRFEERALAGDLYPRDGATVTPLGWAADDLVLAAVDGPPGSYVEGRHLVLMTSPDRPESQWTYRIVMRDVPDVADLSIAVDLVPDLDGTSSQQLTHDFGDTLAQDQRDISWIIGLGVAAAIAVLMALRWLWRRFLG